MDTRSPGRNTQPLLNRKGNREALKKTKDQEEQGYKMTRGTRRKEQSSFKHTQPPQLPLAHSTKEVGNKKTKEQEDQGHKMTRGNKKKKKPY